MKTTTLRGRVSAAAFILAVLLCAAVCSAGDWNLTVFHTNDIHGGFVSQPATWRDDRAEVGGFVALDWWLAREREDAAPSLLFDAGDFMTGNPVCEVEIDGLRGAAMIDLMNALDYDVGVIGNHEFDVGRAGLGDLVDRAEFPMLGAEAVAEDGTPEWRAEPVVFECGEVTVGVMGVSCAGLRAMVPSHVIGGVRLLDQEAVIRGQAAVLEAECDLLVVVSHNGIDEDRLLADALAGSGVDLIVGGHSHTRLREPVVVGELLIVQAGANLKNLGRLDLRVEDDRIVDYEGRLITLLAADAVARPEVADLVDRCEVLVGERFDRVVGRLATPWRRTGGESNIGNWLCDRLRERAGADVAFLNSGGIRRNVDAGPVTMLDLYEVLPFANELVTFEITGAELRTIVERNASAGGGDRHYGVLQVSGLRYAYRRVGDHVEVENLTVGGKALETDRVYAAAAPDYVIAMADRYLDLPAPATEPTGVMLRDAIIDAVSRCTEDIDATVDGRMTDLGDGADGQ